MARGLRSACGRSEILGLPVDYVRLSPRDDGAGYLGRPSDWDAAEAALRAAGEVLASRLPWSRRPARRPSTAPSSTSRCGRGHEETIATVQLDFSQPERFDLTYDAADGSRRGRS